MRDLLIHYCLFVSASRDGVLTEMLLPEFTEGEWVCVKGVRKYHVGVSKHKTALSSGDAPFTLSREVVQWICIFVKHLREKVLLPGNRRAKNEPHILFPWSAKDPGNDKNVTMSSGSISKRLRQMLVVSGVLLRTEGSFTCNILRKATSTGLHQVRPDMDEIMAASMSHSLSTAQQHYQGPDKVTESVKAQSEVSSYWTGAYSDNSREVSREDDNEQTDNIEQTEQYNLWPREDEQTLRSELPEGASLAKIKEKLPNLSPKLKARHLTPKKVHRKLKRLQLILYPRELRSIAKRN